MSNSDEFAKLIKMLNEMGYNVTPISPQRPPYPDMRMVFKHGGKGIEPRPRRQPVDWNKELNILLKEGA